MDTASALVLIVFGAVASLALAAFAVVSLRERERRATRLSVIALLPFVAVLVSPWVLPDAAVRVVAIIVVALIAVAAIAWFLPVGRVAFNGRPGSRVDERDIMFARARLRPGTDEYAAYYAMRPENQRGDDRTRDLPGLLSLDARKAEPEAFASADASFRVTEAMSESVDGPVAERREERSPADAAAMVKGLATSLGALDVGITAVHDYHVYSHVGRGPGVYGEEIPLEHEWAIAFTVEMDHAVMRTAPEAPVVAESARRYVDAGPDRRRCCGGHPGMGLSGQGAHRWQLPGDRPTGGVGRRPGGDREDGPLDDTGSRPTGSHRRGHHRPSVGGGCPRRCCLGARLLHHLQEMRRRLPHQFDPLW